jgi:hypothetical protein
LFGFSYQENRIRHMFWRCFYPYLRNDCQAGGAGVNRQMATLVAASSERGTVGKKMAGPTKPGGR